MKPKTTQELINSFELLENEKALHLFIPSKYSTKHQKGVYRFNEKVCEILYFTKTNRPVAVIIEDITGLGTLEDPLSYHYTYYVDKIHIVNQLLWR